MTTDFIQIQGRPLSTISIGDARLPETYEAAKQALAACVRIDECKSWADKAAAIASYARMADDQDLHRRATKVQGWAVRRVGELLEEFSAGRADDRSQFGEQSDSEVLLL